MKKLPIVGVSANIRESRLEINDQYFNALLASGAVPFLLPYTEDEEKIAAACAVCDGFLFSGGADLDPEYYGEQRLPECGDIVAERDRGEMALVRYALMTAKPILAICRGCQLVNVALGGTLWQDIPTQLDTTIEHKVLPGTELEHTVRIIEGTPLYDLLGKGTIKVNSIHHQAVKALGRGLVASAVADDGIIEAYYHEGKRYIRAYQWHPERIFNISEDSGPIFANFLSACK